jgi:hypothetical protein
MPSARHAIVRRRACGRLRHPPLRPGPTVAGEGQPLYNPEMRVNNYLFALMTVLSLFLATSCATTTYLDSGQLGQDLIVPLPQSRFSEKSNSTMVFAGSSYVKDTKYPDDKNAFVEGGLLHSWRGPNEPTFLDGYLALSGWYGRTSLKDHGGYYDPQYPLSVSQPFAYYGASAEVGEAIGLKVGTNKVIDLGLRCGAAYEDGPYRDFRAEAADLSSDVEDCCPSGWSGNLGFDWALTWSTRENLDIRFGVFVAKLISDITLFFKSSDVAIESMLIQPSIALRYNKIYFAAALSSEFLSNFGINCSLGYILF